MEQTGKFAEYWIGTLHFLSLVLKTVQIPVKAVTEAGNKNNHTDHKVKVFLGNQSVIKCLHCSFCLL